MDAVAGEGRRRRRRYGGDGGGEEEKEEAAVDGRSGADEQVETKVEAVIKGRARIGRRRRHIRCAIRRSDVINIADCVARVTSTSKYFHRMQSPECVQWCAVVAVEMRSCLS